MMKPSVPGVAALLLLLAICGCQAAAQAPEVARLSYFQGEYFGSSIVQFGKTFGIQTGPMTVTQPSPDVVSFGGSYRVQEPGQFSAIQGEYTMQLRYDAKSKQYLLDFSTASSERRSVDHLPLSFAESTGYSGSGTVSVGDQKKPVEVSITLDREKGAHTWEVKIFDPSDTKSADQKPQAEESYTFSFGNKKTPQEKK